MKLNEGDTVYRIIKFPKNTNNFPKYGIHKYIIKKVRYDKVIAVDELDKEIQHFISYFVKYGIFESAYVAKLGLSRLYLNEYCEAYQKMKLCEEEYNRYVKENPELLENDTILEAEIPIED